MKKIIFFWISMFFSLSLNAAVCPDPNMSSLKWGEVPPPFVTNPFSQSSPQGDVNARFVRANILMVGSIGRGVVCTYQHSAGFYSIWWEVGVREPNILDNNWRRSLGGFECTMGPDLCLFYVAS